MEDSKPHTRNLKLISTAFILYWLLELEPSKNEIHLNIISYKVSNSAPLTILAWIALIYFLWRFYLSMESHVKQAYEQIWVKKTRKLINKTFHQSGLPKQPHKDDVGTAFSRTELSRTIVSEFNAQIKEEFEDSISKANDNREFPWLYYELSIANIQFPRAGKVAVSVKTKLQPTQRNESGEGSPRKLEIPKKQFLRFKRAALLRLLFNSEESPDYIIPIALFVLAVTCGFMELKQYSPSDLSRDVVQFWNHLISLFKTYFG